MDVRAKKGKKIIIIVLAAVLAAAAAAAAIIYFKSAGSEQEEKEEVHNLFNCGLLPVKSGDKWGYVDKTGTYIISPQFERARDFSEETGYAWVKNSVGEGYIDTSGAYAPKEKFDELSELEDEMRYRNDDDDTGLTPEYKDGKYGYVDSTGKFVINPQFDTAYRFSCGLAAVGLLKGSADDYDEVYDREYLYGYINTDGKYVAEPKFDRAYPFDSESGLARVEESDKYRYIDKTGAYVGDMSFDKAEDFSGRVALVGTLVGNKSDYEYSFEYEYLYGYIGESTGYVILPQFSDAESFDENGYAAVKLDDKWGIIDKSGAFVTEPSFDDLRSYAGYCDNGLAAAKVGEKWGFIDGSGKFVIEPQFDEVGGFSNGLACAGTIKDWEYDESLVEYGLDKFEANTTYIMGYIDETGSYVIEPRFEIREGYSPGDDYISYGHDMTYGYCDFYDDGYARIPMYGKWGVIDKTGAYVINPQFDK